MKPVLFAGLTALSLAACVQSVNPVHTPETVVMDTTLLGTWMAPDGTLLVLGRRDSTSYRMTVVEPNGEPGRWTAWLSTLGDRRWLDARPEALPAGWGDDYRDAFLPLYSFWVVLEWGDRLRVAGVSYDSLRAVLAETPDAVAHARGVDNRVILTADTRALRRFLLEFAERPGVLEGGDEALVRIRPGR